MTAHPNSLAAHDLVDGDGYQGPFALVPWHRIAVTNESRYLVKGLLPRDGLCVVWGPPKSGKTFWVLDLVMHVALKREYRGRKTNYGQVVYLACEGARGLLARIEAFNQRHLAEGTEVASFWLGAVRLDLAADSGALVDAIHAQMPIEKPSVIVIDTVNRSLNGSESRDEDMAHYLAGADQLRAEFDCLVILIHHCGINTNRPRGHTSLTGACDVQIKITSEVSQTVVAEVEYMKDGEPGATVTSKLETVLVGHDEDGEELTSCVIEPAEPAESIVTSSGPRLTKNQATAFSVLQDAGQGGLTKDEWNERCKEIGIGAKRHADLWDIRKALKGRDLIYERDGRWCVR